MTNEKQQNRKTFIDCYRIGRSLEYMDRYDQEQAWKKLNSAIYSILSPDSFPFVSLPTDHQLELPDILRSEILDQSISLMIIIHIFCYNCCNLIFLLSWCHSPFIYHFRRDALNQQCHLVKILSRQPLAEQGI